MKRIHWNEFIVPAIALAFAISYWIQVKGQSRAVVMVPYIFIALICVLIVGVILNNAVSKADPKDAPQEPAKVHGTFQHWVFSQKKELGLIVLSIAYYFAFDPLGFTGSNLLFLLLAFRVAGVQPKKTVIYSCVTTAVMYVVSELLQLNAPQFPWFLR